MERKSRSLEYKRTITNYRKLAQVVVAFANGDGGRIIVGVEDKSRKVVGLDPERIDEFLERVPHSLADQIHPPVFPQLFEKTIEDKEVLIIQVFPSNQKPCFIAAEGVEKGVYVRVGAHTKRARGEILEELRLLRSRIGYDEAPVSECPFTDLNMQILPPGLQTEAAQRSMGIFRHDTFTGAKLPARGAILMLHPQPERYIPESYTIVSRMRGDKGRKTVESHDLTGSVPHQSEMAIEILEQWLGRDHHRLGARYVNQRWALPMVAVREAVNNALFHRRYSITGPVKIALFATRLEVFSPGHFAGPFIPETLGDGTSYIRNRIVCTIARRLRLIEKRGTGIKLIQDSMADFDLPNPEFEEGSQWFKVTLSMTRTTSLIPEDRYQEHIMRLFETESEISSADVCRELAVSKATAVALLGKLMDGKLIKRVGRGPKTRYIPE